LAIKEKFVCPAHLDLGILVSYL